jgi:hypothetical protein
VNSVLIRETLNTLMWPDSTGHRLANKSIATELLIEVPHKILGSFNLTKLNFTYHDGYLMAGFTPIFDTKKARKIFSRWTY